jgi:hypothetical protein
MAEPEVAEQAPEPQFSVRLVSYDYYMSYPLPGYDHVSSHAVSGRLTKVFSGWALRSARHQQWRTKRILRTGPCHSGVWADAGWAKGLRTRARRVSVFLHSIRRSE